MRLACRDAAAAQPRLGNLAHNAVGAHLAISGPGSLRRNVTATDDMVLQIAADTGQRHAGRDALNA